ncbi:MAG: M23 family metallopeptidase [Bacillota bacterium]
MSLRVRIYVGVLVAFLVFAGMWGCEDAQRGSPSPNPRANLPSAGEFEDTTKDITPSTVAEWEEEFKSRLDFECHVYPETVKQGEYVIVRLTGVPADADAEVSFAGDSWKHSRNGVDEIIAMVPISYYLEPGIRVIGASMAMSEETEYAYGRLRIAPGDFEVQRLYVDSELESRRSPDLWAQDRVHFERARAESHPEALWDGDFIMPVEGRFTSSFGLLRYVNDVASGRHSGLDISAVEGTPIEATASGVVTLAMDLNVTGGTVVIDHGLNLFSLYYHLSRIVVEEGQEIDGGEVIGEVGSTGFSTGAHLHFSISVGETPVDPWIPLEGDPLRFLEE